MLNIIYRLCELETDGNIRDIRPSWYSKQNCLRSFLYAADIAKGQINSITFVHDGPEGPLYEYLTTRTWKPNIVMVQHRCRTGDFTIIQTQEKRKS